MIVRHGVDDPTGTKLTDLQAKKRSTDHLSADEEAQLSTLEARKRGREPGDVTLVGKDG